MYQELRDGEGICVTWSGIAGLKITPGVVAVMGMLFSVRSFLFVTGQITQNLRGIYASGSSGKSLSFYRASGRFGGEYSIRAVFAGSSLLN